MTENHMSVSSRPGRAPPIKILLRDETRELAPGMQAEFQLERKPTVPDAG